jgi:NDP-sugar pyrophosphorylase family protein
MKIIIPMAGLGTRFQKVADQNPEYKKPKPFITVKGYPMIRWATGSLPFIEHPGQSVDSDLRVTPKDLIFVILKEHDETHELARKLKEIYSDNIHVIILDKVTRGAAETAYSANELIDPEEDLIISDTDHFFKGEYLAAAIAGKHPDTVGIIPVFATCDEIPRWSYSLTKPNTNVVEQVGEKDDELRKKGAFANIGAYYFSKAKYFLNEVKEAIEGSKMTGDEGKKEFYVAPLYQNLIEKGLRIEVAVTPKADACGLGTPDDLESFLNNFTHLTFYN